MGGKVLARTRRGRALTERLGDPREHLLEFAFLMLFGLALVGLVLVRTRLLTPDNPGSARPHDLQNYLYMARHGAFSLHIAPYGWRIGLSFIVSLLPVAPAVRFLTNSFVALWLTTVVVYFLVREFGFSRSRPCSWRRRDRSRPAGS